MQPGQRQGSEARKSSTEDTPEFADYRERAWNHIKDLRMGTLFNPRTRLRNKAAALISFAGKTTLVRALRRHG